MKILRLRAHFGKLNGELTLHEGMNLLHLPNESGKSTWSAFVVAMLYGVDTKERRNIENQGLPIKERYQPWDGGAMEGVMELEWNGRSITIQRNSTVKSPMGVFRAYETASGSPIAELTAENCGRMLCGVERSVFERTAFIRQLGLAVTGDARLEQRLNALVSTGEDGARSYSELETALKAKKNQLIGRTGRIPTLQKREGELLRMLETLRGRQEELLRLKDRRETASQEKSRLDALLLRIERAKAAKNRAALEDTEARLRDQEALCRRMEAAALALPEESELQYLQRELHRAENTLETAKLEFAFGGAAPELPHAPPCFTGLTAEQVQEQAASDVAEYHRLSAAKPRRSWPLLLICLAAMLAGAALCLTSLPIGASVAGVGAVAALAVWLINGRRNAAMKKNCTRMQEILATYGVSNIDEIALLAKEYVAALSSYATELQAAQEEKALLQAALEAAQEKTAALVARAKRFAPSCVTAADCREAIAAALHARERLASELRTRDTLRNQARSLKTAFGNATYEAPDAEALTFDEAKLAYEQRQAERHLSELTVRAAELQGTVSAMGDLPAMESELERLQDELAAAQERLAAVELAMDALKTADETLRSRFSPQITAEAGKILAALTADKYPSVLLEPDMRLSVREENGVLMRPAAAMSCGTADQMYLALRLAMCRRLLPEGVPLILDDALVNFDETRAAAALRILRAEAEKRQVLLFTCRNLEIED